MKKLIAIVLLSASFVTAPAMAAGLVVGGVANVHFDTSSLNGSSSFNANGNSNSESASGFSGSLGGNNGSTSFHSDGLAANISTATPFETTSTSAHFGNANGSANGNVSFNAPTIQTFAQGDAHGSFNTSTNVTFSGTETNFNGWLVAGGFTF